MDKKFCKEKYGKYNMNHLKHKRIKEKPKVSNKNKQKATLLLLFHKNPYQ
jgi:hypothetical protein